MPVANWDNVMTVSETHNAEIGYAKAWEWIKGARIATFDQFIMLRNGGVIRRDAEIDKFDEIERLGVEVSGYAIVPVECVLHGEPERRWLRRQLVKLDEWLARFDK